MKKHISFSSASLITILFAITCSSTIAQAPTKNRTMWQPVNSSLSELLNAEWKLINQSTNRVATSTSPGVNGYDEQSFTYTLYKNKKYITCIITEPTIDSAYSKCRLLN
jgi:hypothetical protein